MGKGKNKGQSIARKLRRGVIDIHGNSLKRPFNNSKRKEGDLQTQREQFYFGMKDYLEHLQRKENEQEAES